MTGYILLVFLSTTTFGSVVFLEPEKRYRKKVKQVVEVFSSAPRRREKIDDTLKKQNDELKKLLKRSKMRPLVIDGTRYIPTGTTLRGRLLNSIVSTNLESPLLVEITENNNFVEVGTKFSCFGSTKHKRVHTVCNRLITESGEADVRAMALNIDGSAGLRGQYFEGKEAYVAGMLAANMATGILSASQERLNTSIGQMIVPSTKNKLLEGLIQTAQTGNEILKDELKTNEPVVVIEAGKDILIYFQSRFRKKDIKGDFQ